MKTLLKMFITCFFMSGCTFSPPGKDVRVTLQIGKSGKSFLTSASEADCYAVNVVGPGIPASTPRIKPIDLQGLLNGGKCTGPGITSNLVSGVSNSTIDLQVPTGPDRFIQIVGIEFPAGSVFTSCNTGMNLSEMIRYADSLQLTNGIDDALVMYHLGQVRLDLFADQEVNVPNTFDPTNPVTFNDCGGSVSHGSGIPTEYAGLRFWADVDKYASLSCSTACTVGQDILQLFSSHTTSTSMTGSLGIAPTYENIVFPNSQTRGVARFAYGDYWVSNQLGVYGSSVNGFTVIAVHRATSDGFNGTIVSFTPPMNTIGTDDHFRLFRDSGSPGTVFLGLFDGATTTYGSGSLPANVWSIDTYLGTETGTYKSFRNGQLAGNTPWPSGEVFDLSGRMAMGCLYDDFNGNCAGGYDFVGEIAELIVFDREISDIGRQEIECRLKNKYGIAVANGICQ